MADEIVDVINDNDEVIGKEGKNKCHKEGLWHRTVGIFIFNDNEDLLLQKRSMNMATSPGKYDCSASGHVGSGKTQEEDAIKELKEELGIEINLKLIFKNLTENFDEGKNKIRHLFSLFIGHHNGPFNIGKFEVDSVKFFSFDEMTKTIGKTPNDFTFALKMLFKKYKGEFKE